MTRTSPFFEDHLDVDTCWKCLDYFEGLAGSIVGKTGGSVGDIRRDLLVSLWAEKSGSTCLRLPVESQHQLWFAGRLLSANHPLSCKLCSWLKSIPRLLCILGSPARLPRQIQPQHLSMAEVFLTACVPTGRTQSCYFRTQEQIPTSYFSLSYGGVSDKASSSGTGLFAQVDILDRFIDVMAQTQSFKPCSLYPQKIQRRVHSPTNHMQCMFLIV